MPRFWWIVPWSHARNLHSAACALNAYVDRMERVDDLQRRIIDDQSAEIVRLRRRVADLHESIVAGRAIIPDAQPFDDHA